jgi:hypothetical protein
MTQHLTPQQVLALANGEYLPEAARHTAACPHCAAELKHLTSSLEMFRESVEAMPAWRPRPLVERPTPILRWATAFAATAALTGMFFVFQRQEQTRAEEEMARQDAALMDQLFHGTARVTPASFERFNHFAGTEGNLP